MSLKFYRKPVVDRPWRPPVMDEDCGRYIQMAAKTKKWLPPSLHFEQLVRNTTMPVRPSSPSHNLPRLTSHP
jgi:hypothetical protein